MTNIKIYAKAFLRDFIHLLVNNVFNIIPCWTIRKLLYKLCGMKIGSGSRINMHCRVMSPWKIEIGEHTMINEYALIDGRGGVRIGDSCSVSAYAIIYTASHYSSSDKFEYYSKQTKIDDCCWIGARAIIMPGSHLSECSIISVNSVFKGETKPNYIYSGIPAIELRERKLSDKYVMEIVDFFI